MSKKISDRKHRAMVKILWKLIKNCDLLILEPMVKIKSSICFSFKPSSALRQRTDIPDMFPLACLDGDLKSGTAVTDLIVTIGLNREQKRK